MSNFEKIKNSSINKNLRINIIRKYIEKAQKGKDADTYPEFISSLLTFIDSNNEDISLKEYYVYALYFVIDKTDAKDKDVISTLLTILNKDDDEYIDIEIQSFSADLLGKMGKRAVKDPQVISTLLTILKKDDQRYKYLQRFCITALGKMGEAAARNPDVIPAILYILNKTYLDNVKNLKLSCIEALGKMGEAAAKNRKVISALIRELRISIDKDLKEKAAEALGHIGKAVPTNSRIIPFLLNILNYNEGNIYERIYCANTLEIMGEVAVREEVISTLLTILKKDYNSQLYKDDNSQLYIQLQKSCANALASMSYKLFLIPNIIELIPDKYKNIIDKVEKEYYLWLIYHLQIKTDIPYITQIYQDHISEIFNCIK
jgi:HEAT repeat protein